MGQLHRRLRQDRRPSGFQRLWRVPLFRQRHDGLYVRGGSEGCGPSAGLHVHPHHPTRRTAVFLHEGPLEKIPETWMKIFDEWLPAAKLEVAHGPQFEVYGEDENKIEIFIPVI